MQKDYFRFYLPLMIISLLLFSACASVSHATPAKTEAIVEQTDLVISEPTAVEFPPLPNDMTRICGIIVDNNGGPIDSVVIFFPEVYYSNGNSDGAFVLSTSASPSALTDSQGHFCTKEIPAFDYVLVIGSPDAEYEIFSEDGTKAALWTPTAGEILDIGEIKTTVTP